MNQYRVLKSFFDHAGRKWHRGEIVSETVYTKAFQFRNRKNFEKVEEESSSSGLTYQPPTTDDDITTSALNLDSPQSNIDTGNDTSGFDFGGGESGGGGAGSDY